jgi:hypothetical protein
VKGKGKAKGREGSREARTHEEPTRRVSYQHERKRGTKKTTSVQSTITRFHFPFMPAELPPCTDEISAHTCVSFFLLWFARCLLLSRKHAWCCIREDVRGLGGSE